MNTVAKQSGSVLIDMATRYGMLPESFELTVRATCSPRGKDARPLTREEFAAFLLVAREHRLNPLLREIYAFPARGGGVVPVVSVDGWINLVNSHPAFDGMEFLETHTEQGGLISIECTIWRKDRQRPTKVREHLTECYRDTDPWKMPHRMLRHKALIQTARYAFGFGGIYDEEEAQTIAEGQVVVRRGPPQAPRVVDVSGDESGAKRITAGLKRAAEHARSEGADPDTGEITDVSAKAADPQTAAGHQKGASTRAKASPSTDVRGGGLDSSAVAHQGSQREAADSGSPTPSGPDGATKAFMAYAKDLGAATEADNAEIIRDGYMTQHGMAWTREQKEQAAHLYSIAITRIEAQQRNADIPDEPEDGYPDDSFPGDTPAEANTAPPAAEKPKRARKPPKAPEPAQQAPEAAEGATTAQGYRKQFMDRYDAVETVEQGKALKSWWFASAAERNSCGCSDALKEEMRNMWTSRLIELQQQG